MPEEISEESVENAINILRFRVDKEDWEGIRATQLLSQAARMLCDYDDANEARKALEAEEKSDD